ncbi:MAG: BatA domain-containing protein, partial [Planctomycetota bacterium]
MIGGFINPLLALGALLAAVPLIIHLLNRQRHRPVEWGAMRFVLAAYKKTRRRTQLENLLLLLLRMLAVVVLALALARPFAGDQSPLAPLTESRRDVVLMIDASASTGYREPSGAVFERILERARDLLAGLDGGRGDRARLILADDRPQLLSWRSPEDAASLLATLTEPSDGPLDLPAAIGVALTSLDEDAGELVASEVELRLLTDLQRRTFGLEDADGEGAELDRELGRALGELAERELTLVVEDLGPADLLPPNLGVVDVELLGDLLGPGLPVDVSVTVANHGGSAANGLRLSLEVDGVRQPVRTLDVAGRSETSEVFSLVFENPGPHVLSAAIEIDRLAFDDSRTVVVHVPDSVQLLLVNGDPDTSALENDEVGLLAAALAPPDDGAGALDGFTPFAIETVDPAALDDSNLDLARRDVIVLANVETLSNAALERLATRVAAGAGLIVTLGDRVSPAEYSRRMFDAGGGGLLPAEPLDVVAVPSRREGYYRVNEFDTEHPALRFFADERWRPLLTEVPIYTYVSVDPLPDARTLATLDSGDDPLLVERAFGAGRVLLWTTSIDRDWTRVPESASTLIPLVHELVRHAGRGPSRQLNVELGEPIVASFDLFPRQPAVVTADGLRRPIEEEPVELGGGRWRLPPIEDTARAGLLRIEAEGQGPLAFSVLADASEGRLARMAPGEVESLHPALQIARGDRSGADAASVAPRGELWRGLAWTCLGLLVAESLWSAW